MKKFTQSILLAFAFVTVITINAQEPLYNFDITLLSTNGLVETYQVTALGTTATPSVYNVQDFNIALSWLPGDFTSFNLITAGAYGDASFYDANDLYTANTVNTAPSFSITLPSNKDIVTITYSGALYTDLGGLGTSINLIQFSVTRGTALIGVLPEIADNTGVSVTNLVNNSFNVTNSFITDIDGQGIGTAASERYSNATLSTPKISINDVAFKAYPNPSQDIINVNNPTANEYQYTVKNLLGQDMGINGTLRPNGTTQLSLGQLQKAIYFIAISNGNSNSIKTLKVIIK